jgi:hypothetical protein
MCTIRAAAITRYLIGAARLRASGVTVVCPKARKQSGVNCFMGLIIAVVGGGLGFLQLIVLFVLSDLRERIMRLESRQMAGAK